MKLLLDEIFKKYSLAVFVLTAKDNTFKTLKGNANCNPEDQIGFLDYLKLKGIST